MGLIFCMFVHIAIKNNHTKFRLNQKTFRYIFRVGHFDPPPAFGGESETCFAKAKLNKKFSSKKPNFRYNLSNEEEEDVFPYQMIN